MQKRINGTLCDTEKATIIGNKAIGEYGDPTGYEEILYINKRKQYFLYGNGGLESQYTKPTMVLFTDEQAEAWKKENGIKTPKPETVKQKKAPVKAKTAVKTKPAGKKSKTEPAKDKKAKTDRISTESKR
jgi:hypothetical protein